MLTTCRRFVKARRGLAAVEFAFIAPLLITLFFGSVEVVQAVDCRTRVTDMASTTADLVAQSTYVSTADVDNIFGAANAILFPYPTAGTQIVVSSLVDDGHGGAKVAWSQAENTSPLQVGSSVTVPDGLIVPGSGGSVILAQIKYVYASPTAGFLKLPIDMQDRFYSKPRRSVVVKHT